MAAATPSPPLCSPRRGSLQTRALVPRCVRCWPQMGGQKLPKVRYILGELVGHVTSIAQFKTVRAMCCKHSPRVQRGFADCATCASSAHRRSCGYHGGIATRRLTLICGGTAKYGRMMSTTCATLGTWCVHIPAGCSCGSCVDLRAAAGRMLMCVHSSGAYGRSASNRAAR